MLLKNAVPKSIAKSLSLVRPIKHLWAALLYLLLTGAGQHFSDEISFSQEAVIQF